MINDGNFKSSLHELCRSRAWKEEGCYSCFGRPVESGENLQATLGIMGTDEHVTDLWDMFIQVMRVPKTK